MSELEFSENKTVVDKIVTHITNAIKQGEMKLGDKIPTEPEFMSKLKVGRNSVREAIKMLSAMGLLEIRRGDGTYICDKVGATIFDSLIFSLVMQECTKDQIIELREAIEVEVLELAVDKADVEDIKCLQEKLDNFHACYSKVDINRAAELDLEFHYSLIDISRNPLLGRIAKIVLKIFYTSIKNTLQANPSKSMYHKSHQEMINLLINKDKEHIREVVKNSLTVWKKLY